MIERERDARAMACHDLTFDHPRLLLDSANTQDGDLGIVKDWRREHRAAGQPAEACDGECAILEVRRRAAPLACLTYKSLDLLAHLHERETIRVPDHGHHQAARYRRGNPD